MSNEQSDNTNEIAKALAAAQAKMSNAAKNAVNPHLKNRYADLSAVRAAVIGPLSEQGIAVCQSFRTEGRCVIVVTKLLHSSGQWLRSELGMELPPDGKQNAAQQMGSLISYLRRYSLAAIASISADEDDDAEGAAPTKATQPQGTSPVDGWLRDIAAARTPEQLARIGAQINQWRVAADKEAVRAQFHARQDALKRGAA